MKRLGSLQVFNIFPFIPASNCKPTLIYLYFTFCFSVFISLYCAFLRPDRTLLTRLKDMSSQLSHLESLWVMLEIRIIYSLKLFSRHKSRLQLCTIFMFSSSIKVGLIFIDVLAKNPILLIYQRLNVHGVWHMLL